MCGAEKKAAVKTDRRERIPAALAWQRKPGCHFGKKARKDTVSGVLPGLFMLYVLGISHAPAS